MESAASPAVTGGPVEGECDPRFERVREAFARNFAERAELGAAVCVMVDGVPVVDLWGGVADDRTGRAWERDTMNVIQSCSKGVASLCAHILVDRGELDLDAPIARYWPEFAQNGKAEIPVRMGLNHQSGVSHLSGIVPPGGIDDYELMVRMTAESTPFWKPGTKTGYHALTIGWITGELVRRITGQTIGTFLREQVTGPLGDLDCWIGLPSEHEARVSRTVEFDVPSETGMSQKAWEVMSDPASRRHKALRGVLSFPPARAALVKAAVRRSLKGDPEQRLPADFVAAMLDPKSPTWALLTNMGGRFGNVDTRAAHAAEIPAAGAIASARGLAGVYAPLSTGGEHAGVRIVSPEAIARMRSVQSATEFDAVLGVPTTFTLGFSKSWPGYRPGTGMILGEDAFGTPGLGGQMGFADPSYRVAFAYVMNRHGVGTGLNDRGQSLVDATYESLGSPGRGNGFWMRPAAD
jgi:CubicO group peptidase (beta-lactamase class C family)